jgi:tetratricopeptide (TPR) repeat protein
LILSLPWPTTTAGVELDSELTLAYYYRGRAQRSLENYDEAIADFNMAIELDPDLALAYYHRGRSHQALEQLPAAIADFQAVIERSADEALVDLARLRLEALGVAVP